MSIVLRYTYLELTDDITFSIGGNVMNKGATWDSVVQDVAGIKDSWLLTVNAGGCLESEGGWSIQNGIVLLDGGSWTSLGDIMVNGVSTGEGTVSLSVSGEGSSWLSKGEVHLGLGASTMVQDISKGASWESVGSVTLGSSVQLNIQEGSIWRVLGAVFSHTTINHQGEMMVSGVFQSTLIGAGGGYRSCRLAQSSFLGALMWGK